MIQVQLVPREARAVEQIVGAVLNQYGSIEYLPRELYTLLAAYHKLVKAIHEAQPTDLDVDDHQRSAVGQTPSAAGGSVGGPDIATANDSDVQAPDQTTAVGDRAPLQLDLPSAPVTAPDTAHPPRTDSGSVAKVDNLIARS